MKNPETNESPRLFLVDDYLTSREGLAQLLAMEGFTICGEADNSTQTFDMLSDACPDLVLVELFLDGESSLDLIRELTALKIRTLVYTTHDEALFIERAFAAGALGFVTKREQPETLITAISKVLSGRRYVSDVAALNLANRVLSMQKVNHETMPEACHLES